MEYKKLTKKQFDLLAKALDWDKIKCCECGKKITRDNFGILTYNYTCCNNPICQIATFDKIEEESEPDELGKIEKRLLKAFETRHRIHLEKGKRVRVQEVIKSIIKEIRNEALQSKK